MKDVSSWGRWEQTGPNTWQGRAAAEGEVDPGSRVPRYPLLPFVVSLLALLLVWGSRMVFRLTGAGGTVNLVSLALCAALACATGGLWLWGRRGPASAGRGRLQWVGPPQAGHARPVRVSEKGEGSPWYGGPALEPISSDEMIRLHELMAGDGDFRTWTAGGPERWSRGSGSGA
jgi:hypothetical protein